MTTLSYAESGSCHARFSVAGLRQGKATRRRRHPAFYSTVIDSGRFVSLSNTLISDGPLPFLWCWMRTAGLLNFIFWRCLAVQ